MYENYFGLDTLPFGITPDPRFSYDTPDCRKAMASLCSGIEGRRGIILITGEPGTGKTRLVNDFLQRAQAKIRTACITAPNLIGTQLLYVVLNELGVVPSSHDRTTLTRQLKDYLIEQLEKNRFVALLVDEAQQMSNEVLEELRLLSDLQTNGNKLIQIVLVGQPKLEERLEQPGLHKLSQRIAIRCRLVPLTDEEVGFYIEARLKTAGLQQKNLFDPKALGKVALYSNGIPRVINTICDSALLTCFGLSKKTVSADMIEEVARDLDLLAQPSNEKLNVAQPDSAKEEASSRKEVAGVTATSQRPLAAEIQDVFMMAAPRRPGINRRLSLPSLATGFGLGVLTAAGVGAFFYSQENKNYVSELAARVLNGTDRRESVNDGAPKPGALPEVSPAAQLKDVQPTIAEKPLVAKQPPDESSVGATPAPIVEPSQIGSLPTVDSPDQPLEKPTAKTDERNENPKRPTIRGSNKVASDRLEFDVHRAIAKHLIRGVEVSVVDGTVFLRGRVNTDNQKIAAAKAASNVPGVKYVRDEIVVNHDLAS